MQGAHRPPRAGGRFRANQADPPLAQIREFFHLPVEEASERLGVNKSKLKRLCREYGVSRWPQRKLQSLSALREHIQRDGRLSEEELQALLGKLEQQVESVLQDPDKPLEREFEDMRKNVYKVRYQKRKQQRLVGGGAAWVGEAGSAGQEEGDEDGADDSDTEHDGDDDSAGARPRSRVRQAAHGGSGSGSRPSIPDAAVGPSRRRGAEATAARVAAQGATGGDHPGGGGSSAAGVEPGGSAAVTDAVIASDKDRAQQHQQPARGIHLAATPRGQGRQMRRRRRHSDSDDLDTDVEEDEESRADGERGPLTAGGGSSGAGAAPGWGGALATAASVLAPLPVGTRGRKHKSHSGTHSSSPGGSTAGREVSGGGAGATSRQPVERRGSSGSAGAGQQATTDGGGGVGPQAAQSAAAAAVAAAVAGCPLEAPRGTVGAGSSGPRTEAGAASASMAGNPQRQGSWGRGPAAMQALARQEQLASTQWSQQLEQQLTGALQPALRAPSIGLQVRAADGWQGTPPPQGQGLCSAEAVAMGPGTQQAALSSRGVPVSQPQHSIRSGGSGSHGRMGGAGGGGGSLDGSGLAHAGSTPPGSGDLEGRAEAAAQRRLPGAAFPVDSAGGTDGTSQGRSLPPPPLLQQQQSYPWGHSHSPPSFLHPAARFYPQPPTDAALAPIPRPPSPSHVSPQHPHMQQQHHPHYPGYPELYTHPARPPSSVTPSSASSSLAFPGATWRSASTGSAGSPPRYLLAPQLGPQHPLPPGPPPGTLAASGGGGWAAPPGVGGWEHHHLSHLQRPYGSGPWECHLAFSTPPRRRYPVFVQPPPLPPSLLQQQQQQQQQQFSTPAALQPGLPQPGMNVDQSAAEGASRLVTSSSAQPGGPAGHSLLRASGPGRAGPPPGYGYGVYGFYGYPTEAPSGVVVATTAAEATEMYPSAYLPSSVPYPAPGHTGYPRWALGGDAYDWHPHQQAQPPPLSQQRSSSALTYAPQHHHLRHHLHREDQLPSASLPAPAAAAAASQTPVSTAVIAPLPPSSASSQMLVRPRSSVTASGPGTTPDSTPPSALPTTASLQANQPPPLLDLPPSPYSHSGGGGAGRGGDGAMHPLTRMHQPQAQDHLSLQQLQQRWLLQERQRAGLEPRQGQDPPLPQPNEATWVDGGMAPPLGGVHAMQPPSAAAHVTAANVSPWPKRVHAYEPAAAAAGAPSPQYGARGRAPSFAHPASALARLASGGGGGGEVGGGGGSGLEGGMLHDVRSQQQQLLLQQQHPQSPPPQPLLLQRDMINRHQLRLQQQQQQPLEQTQLSVRQRALLALNSLLPPQPSPPPAPHPTQPPAATAATQELDPHPPTQQAFVQPQQPTPSQEPLPSLRAQTSGGGGRVSLDLHASELGRTHVAAARLGFGPVDGGADGGVGGFRGSSARGTLAADLTSNPVDPGSCSSGAAVCGLAAERAVGTQSIMHGTATAATAATCATARDLAAGVGATGAGGSNLVQAGSGFEATGRQEGGRSEGGSAASDPLLSELWGAQSPRQPHSSGGGFGAQSALGVPGFGAARQLSGLLGQSHRSTPLEASRAAGSSGDAMKDVGDRPIAAPGIQAAATASSLGPSALPAHANATGAILAAAGPATAAGPTTSGAETGSPPPQEWQQQLYDLYDSWCGGSPPRGPPPEVVSGATTAATANAAIAFASGPGLSGLQGSGTSDTGPRTSTRPTLPLPPLAGPMSQEGANTDGPAGVPTAATVIQAPQRPSADSLRAGSVRQGRSYAVSGDAAGLNAAASSASAGAGANAGGAVSGGDDGRVAVTLAADV